jgi:hypothetical protein
MNSPISTLQQRLFHKFKSHYQKWVVRTSASEIRKVNREVNLLKKQTFDALWKVTFVFQTFNKGKITKKLLSPFIKLKVKNIIFFADGCVDITYRYAKEILKGENHIIISSNNVHEIKNYRTSIGIASNSFKSEFILLMQDDDIYDDNLELWLNNALLLMAEDPSVGIIGFNGGFNTVGEITPADDGLTSASFENFEVNGIYYYRIGKYETCQILHTTPTHDGSNWEYCEIVNRAPQLTRIKFLTQLEAAFPLDMEPFQYDDHWHCLMAWEMGWRIAYMPLKGIERNVGIGGMRLFNNITPNSRPKHFIHNWNKICQRFSDLWGSTKLKSQVESANKSKKLPKF